MHSPAEITSATAGTPISVVSGDTIQFRGNNLTYSTGTSAYNSFSGTTAEFSVKGNIMSLISSSGFAALNVLTSARTFSYLMCNCTGLTDVSKLVLPATTLAGYCYANMFSGCTSLTTAPELPATTLASGCHYFMFYRCTALTTAPELPATALTSECYASMFNGCTSLTTAPELPATALTGSCYSAMFNGCTSLNYIKAMFTTTPSTTYTLNWTKGVSSTGTFVKNSSAQWDVRGADGIPTNWTVETASE